MNKILVGIFISTMLLGTSFAETITIEEQRVQYTENLNKWIEHQRKLELERIKIEVILEQQKLLTEQKEEINITIINSNKANSSSLSEIEQRKHNHKE